MFKIIIIDMIIDSDKNKDRNRVKIEVMNMIKDNDINKYRNMFFLNYSNKFD